MKLKFFLTGILAGLLIAASPLLFSFSKKYIAGLTNKPKQEPVLIKATGKDSNDRHSLPLAADIFLASEQIFIKPTRHWDVKEANIPAKIALIYETSQNNILFKKNGINEPRPIASLTKMMTALVVIDNTKLDSVFTVSKNAVDTIGNMGGLAVEEKLTVESLLKILLIESSNDAAIALAENIAGGNVENFVSLMNAKAQTLGLKNTFFADSSGLSPANKSTAWELILIMKEILKNPLLSEIMRSATADVISQNNQQHHLTNTNKLLFGMTDIIAGKTGYTEEAGNCMVLAVKSPYNGGAIISVVMGAEDRLAETETLIKWTKEAFLW